MLATAEALSTRTYFGCLRRQAVITRPGVHTCGCGRLFDSNGFGRCGIRHLFDGRWGWRPLRRGLGLLHLDTAPGSSPSMPGATGCAFQPHWLRCIIDKHATRPLPFQGPFQAAQKLLCRRSARPNM